MAAWLRVNSLRQHLLITLLLLLDLPSLLLTSQPTSVFGGDLTADDRDRTSVKKELRNPNRWMGTGLTEEEEIEPIKGFYLNEGSEMLASFLRSVSNEELGVTTLQTMYDSLPFGVLEKDDTTRVKDLSDRLQRKLSRYISLVNLSRSAIEELFWHHLHRPLSNPAPCCELPDSMLRYDTHFGVPVSEELSCDVSVSNQKPLSFAPGHNLTDVFSNNLKISPSIKWQYFLSTDGSVSEYPAHHGDSKGGCNKPNDPFRRRDLYLSSLHPEPKFIVMVIDHGNALSANQLSIAKAIGKYIVSSLTDRDHIGLIALSDELHYAGIGDCFTRRMTRANRRTKQKLNRFIDSLTKAKAPANHTMGFRQALDMARQAMLMDENEANSNHHKFDNCAGNQTCNHWMPSVGDCPTAITTPVLLVYISRGLLSSLAEPRQVLELIALGQLCLQGRLVINTYTLIDDGKPIMYEKAFLQDVAIQNYSRYNVSFAALERLPIMRGQALAINSTRWLSSTIGDFQAPLFNTTSTHLTTTSYSSPYWDSIGKGMVVSLTQPCYHLDLLVGAVGLDIHLADLVEDFTYFNAPGGRSYVFLIDTTGTVAMHPSLARPSTLSDESVATDILFLESRPGFAAIRKRILSVPSGSERIALSPTSSDAFDINYDDDEPKIATIKYTWERVGATPYIACIVTRYEKADSEGQPLRRVPPSSLPDLVYHRLDVVSSPNKVDLCRYFRQHSTLAVGSLFLSPAAHLSSFQFASWAEPSPVVIQSFMAFLSDKTKLIANPGLRSSVRSDVGALAQIVPHWRTQFGHSLLSQFILRRYAATPNGVMIEYPAAVRPASFDPLRRPWYQKAIEFPGRVVVTGPYLDPSGAGYVVSISHSVYEGKPSARHSSSDNVVTILGADLTLSYMHRMLWATLPFCPDRTGQVRGSSIRCFIMDERGYLLVHPNLLDPLAQGAVEQQHLTHHEPLVASDLLNHDRFVLKKACSSYPDRTVQRFYQLNLTLNEKWIDPSGANEVPMPVLTNLVHGEHCIRYQIVAIQGTNLFVGVVNQTCESATAFCPCSTVDRLCLNCHRMEQSECECPCECPLELETCINMSDMAQSQGESLPTCPAQSEMFSSLPSPSPRSRDLDQLPSCIALDCESRLSERECFGVVGCEWCVRDTDTHTPLQGPFCTQHHKCYGGILRGPSPYSGESNDGSLLATGTFGSAPLIPMTVGAFALLVIITVVVLCYRHRSRHNGNGVYGSGSAAGLQMTQLNNDMDEHDDIEPDVDETTAVVKHEFNLGGGSGLDNIAIVSPYRVNTGYRRPAGGDSDHGYSTMTPHDDSEHTASYVEPLLVGRERYRHAVRSISTGSFSSRASSPLGPVYHPGPSRTIGQRITSPGTLLESADELDAEINDKGGQKELMDLHSPLPIQQLDSSLGMTVLPDTSFNQVIVPVTVHMVDTT